MLVVRGGLVAQIKEMGRHLRIIVGQSQACEIMMTIPGVGIQTSAAFGAAIIMASRLGDVAGIVTLQRWRPTAELLELGGTVLAYIWLATSSLTGCGRFGRKFVGFGAEAIDHEWLDVRILRPEAKAAEAWLGSLVKGANLKLYRLWYI